MTGEYALDTKIIIEKDSNGNRMVKNFHNISATNKLLAENGDSNKTDLELDVSGSLQQLDGVEKITGFIDSNTSPAGISDIKIEAPDPTDLNQTGASIILEPGNDSGNQAGRTQVKQGNFEVPNGHAEIGEGVEQQQRGDPGTGELADGQCMTYCSDGSGTGSAGDLVYAVNDSGTIKTSIIAQRSNATQ